MKRNSNQKQIPKKALVSVSIISFVVAIDQIIKLFVIQSGILWSCNPGFAFGLLPGLLNGLIAFSILIVILYLFLRQKEFILYASLALIIGGGIANITDRIFRGCVVDFIRIPLWPTTFNLADFAITFGVLILIFSIVKNFSKT